MEYSSHQQPTQPAAVPPGWYPDPLTGAGERYWDGIAWSREFTRSGPPPTAPQAAAPEIQQAAAATATPVGREGLAPGVIAMAIGAILIVARIYYVLHTANPGGTGDAYAQGSLLGNLFGMVLGAAVFAFGVGRYRSAKLSADGEPASDAYQLAIPMTVALTVIQLAVFAFAG